MLKSSKKIKKMLMLSCMCSVAFYMGSQVVTYTEATFVNETKIHSTVSTAIVFPKTIDTMVKEAKQRESVILKLNEGMNKEVNTDSVEMLEQKVNELRKQVEQVKVEREALQRIYVETESYYKQSVENVSVNNSDSSKEVLQYVQAGFTTVKNITDNMDQNISVPKIEEFIFNIQKKIEDEKTKQTNNTTNKSEQAEQEQVIPSSKQQESSKQEEIKQPLQSTQEQLNQAEKTEKNNPVLQQQKENKEEVQQQDASVVQENR
ncbi:DUF4047 domain-containing protein [Bacillus sp. C1]